MQWTKTHFLLFHPSLQAVLSHAKKEKRGQTRQRNKHTTDWWRLEAENEGNKMKCWTEVERWISVDREGESQSLESRENTSIDLNNYLVCERHCSIIGAWGVCRWLCYMSVCARLIINLLFTVWTSDPVASILTSTRKHAVCIDFIVLNFYSPALYASVVFFKWIVLYHSVSNQVSTTPDSERVNSLMFWLYSSR